MLEYLAYGAIGISMATAILTFRLLSSEQKKDVPNESILKMIKWFMGLTVFFAIFFGIVELVKGDGEPEIISNFKTSIDQIKKKQLETFAIRGNEFEKKKVDVVLYYQDEESARKESAVIGTLDSKLTRKFAASKGGNKDGKSEWNVLLGEAKLGSIFSSWNTLSKKARRGEWVDTKKWYRLNTSNGQLSDFWFWIEEIHWIGKADTTGDYKFTVIFGEGKSKESIKESERYDFYESPNGMINLPSLKPLMLDDWKRDYFVAFGAGQPTKSSRNSSSIDRVELYNVYAIQMSLNE